MQAVDRELCMYTADRMRGCPGGHQPSQGTSPSCRRLGFPQADRLVSAQDGRWLSGRRRQGELGALLVRTGDCSDFCFATGALYSEGQGRRGIEAPGWAVFHMWPGAGWSRPPPAGCGRPALAGWRCEPSAVASVWPLARQGCELTCAAPCRSPLAPVYTRTAPALRLRFWCVAAQAQNAARARAWAVRCRRHGAASCVACAAHGAASSTSRRAGAARALSSPAPPGQHTLGRLPGCGAAAWACRARRARAAARARAPRART